MTDTINNLKVEQVDIETIQKMHAEFKATYEQRVHSLTNTFHTMLSDMKRDYDA